MLGSIFEGKAVETDWIGYCDRHESKDGKKRAGNISYKNDCRVCKHFSDKTHPKDSEFRPGCRYSKQIREKKDGKSVVTGEESLEVVLAATEVFARRPYKETGKRTFCPRCKNELSPYIFREGEIRCRHCMSAIKRPIVYRSTGFRGFLNRVFGRRPPTGRNGGNNEVI